MKSKILFIAGIAMSITLIDVTNAFSQWIGASTSGATYRPGRVGIGLTSLPVNEHLVVADTMNKGAKVLIGGKATLAPWIPFSPDVSEIELQARDSIGHCELNMFSHYSAADSSYDGLEVLSANENGIYSYAVNKVANPFVVLITPDNFGTAYYPFVAWPTGEVGVNTGPAFTPLDQMTIQGNLDMYQPQDTLARGINARTKGGTLFVYANTGIHDGASITLSGYNTSAGGQVGSPGNPVRGEISFTSTFSDTVIDKCDTTTLPIDPAFDFSIVRGPLGNTKPFVSVCNGLPGPTLVPGNPIDAMTILKNGQVGIGTGPMVMGSSLLTVNGSIDSKGLNVAACGLKCWPDFVFDKNYNLMSLPDVEMFITKNKHLPNLPSASDIQQAGKFSVGETETQILQSLEELYLHVIKLEKENTELKAKIANLEK